MGQWLYERPEYYDIFYADKAYKKEVAFLDEAINTHLSTVDPSILILGCGTGRHAQYLRDRGYDIIGVDKRRSMLSIAQRRSDASFVQAVLPAIPFQGPFDVVFLPFGVLNYLDFEDVQKTLTAISEVLADEGLLMFDIIDKVEQQTVTMQVRQTQKGEFCRLIQISPLSAQHDRYEYFILANEESLYFRSHIEDLFKHNQTDISDVLEEHSYVTTIREGYGTGGYLDDILTVFTAIRPSQ